MTPDYAIVGGILVLALAVPSILSAFVDGRAPRLASLMLLIGTGLVAWAISETPGGYALADLPRAFVRVIGELVN